MPAEKVSGGSGKYKPPKEKRIKVPGYRPYKPKAPPTHKGRKNMPKKDMSGY